MVNQMSLTKERILELQCLSDRLQYEQLMTESLKEIISLHNLWDAVLKLHDKKYSKYFYEQEKRIY